MYRFIPPLVILRASLFPILRVLYAIVRLSLDKNPGQEHGFVSILRVDLIS